MSQIEVLPLFSSPLFTTLLSGDFEAVFRELRDESRFPYRSAVEPGESRMSQENRILESFPMLEEALLTTFERAKNEILKYEKTRFRITTSWLTKTAQGEASHYHIHKNAMFSGVLYFDTIEGGAAIEFANFNVSPRSIDVDKPTQRNVYNSNVISVTPQKNMLLFFPSYLYHRVTPHHASQARYSLAFNLMPLGLVSTTADSQFDFGE